MSHHAGAKFSTLFDQIIALTPSKNASADIQMANMKAPILRGLTTPINTGIRVKVKARKLAVGTRG